MLISSSPTAVGSLSPFALLKRSNRQEIAAEERRTTALAVSTLVEPVVTASCMARANCSAALRCGGRGSVWRCRRQCRRGCRCCPGRDLPDCRSDPAWECDRDFPDQRVSRRRNAWQGLPEDWNLPAERTEWSLGRVKKALDWMRLRLLRCCQSLPAGLSSRAQTVVFSFVSPSLWLGWMQHLPQVVDRVGAQKSGMRARVTTTGCLLWVDCTKCHTLTESLQAFLQGVQDD